MDTATNPATPAELTSDAVRAALIDLLTGHDHTLATPATLDAVHGTRRALATRYRETDPAARWAHTDQRLAALTRALGAIGSALYDHPTRRDHRLHTGLCELATVALAWLDTLPTPPDPTSSNGSGASGQRWADDVTPF